MPAFQTPVGTRDVLPPESARWEALVAHFAGRVERAGYGLVVSPTFEDVAVFERVGEATDVVRKEMYDFDDKGGRRLALRPEGTASVVRAFVQHRPPVPFKAWYVAPNFRYERPQKGRLRQHHQLGVEALGSDDPDLDVEVIALADRFYRRDLGLEHVTLLLNSLGDAACRPPYLDALRTWLSDRAAGLCEEHRERYADNPLRVLDCKREACATQTKDAPRMLDNLCEACATHFAAVRSGLDALGIAFTLEPRLVRGLDYYTRTTFEFQTTALDAAQNAVGGGGRYDGLAEALGGPPTPGIGFGIGIERLLLACDAEGRLPLPGSRVAVWVVDVVGQGDGPAIVDQLREAGIGADRGFDQRSMKAQFKLADRSGAALAVVIGEQEAAEGSASVRDLRGEGGQETVSRDQLVDTIRKRLDA